MKFMGIGMRTIKTALSAFIILIICGIFSAITGLHATGFYGCLTAIICMQHYAHQTYQTGLQRIAGSFIGATLALAYYTAFGMPEGALEIAIVVSISIILAIHITNMLDMNLGSSVAAIIIVSCFTVVPKEAVVVTIIIRCCETILGVIVTTLVNNYIAPYRVEDN